MEKFLVSLSLFGLHVDRFEVLPSMLKGRQDEPYPILWTLSTNILYEPNLKCDNVS